jgi:1-deoxy-D-xylulose-5-phosphate synthase
MTSLLATLDSPAELRQLDRRQLPELADELRAFLIETVSSTGGHLASNLGAVELTIALHYVFDTPNDRLVWDVGHQAYGHKALTGRHARMGTLRQHGGLSGFPRPDESEYDAFIAGHSSTSISAALGMAVAFQRQELPNKAVAIIGDGALTGGMAFEALNNAGAMDTDLLVILNDNDMSISPNVGALNNHLARLMSGRFYAAARKASERVLKNLPPVLELAKRAEEHMKGMVTPSTLFEEFGFNYIGPVDGHDLDVLVTTLSNIKQLSGPQFLHVVTQKGKGFKLAEDDPCRYHGVAKFDPDAGVSDAPGKLTYTQVFGDWLCDAAAREERLVGITPAMCEGSGMVRFAREYPQRYFDVGIAEQHALTFAAGLAKEGMKPVVAIYSTFLQRGYDQLIHDIALQNLPVLLAIDRAGLVGADGPTHAGAFDLSFLRCVPNLLVMAPSDENQCRRMLETGLAHAGPAAVRYPRGAGVGEIPDPNAPPLVIGKGEMRRHGEKIAFLAFGSLLRAALLAAEELNASVADMRFVKPLDEHLVIRLAATHELLVTVEENVVMGGAGSAVAEALARHGVTANLLQLGLPDRFVEHGDTATLLAECGLDAAGLVAAARARLPD